MDTHTTEHPEVLNHLTATQMTELFRQFDDVDRPSFDSLVASYGFDRETGAQIWDWFLIRESGARNGPRPEGG